MICKNCGKEFDGKFCPDCGTPVEENSSTVCPNCGHERLADSKFCVNCGFNFDASQSNEVYENVEYVTKEGNKAKKSLAKVYRFFMACGMLLVGIISMLCLLAPTVKEELWGMKEYWESGFNVIANGAKVDTLVDICITLLVVSIFSLLYGAVQLYLAIKKPYKTVKNFIFWIIDGIIMLMLIILGAIVSSIAMREGANGKAGSGFTMCIVMGVLGLVLLAIRIYYEIKVFKWKDTSLSKEQIEKAQDKKIRKKLNKKTSRIIIASVVIAVALVAIIVPSVVVSTNIFQINKVDKINIGDRVSQVVDILGEPDERGVNKYLYYTSGHGKGKEYKYIQVDFDVNGKVTLVFFDAKRMDNKNNIKEIKSYEAVTEEVTRYVETDIVFKSVYTDGSFCKYIAIHNFTFVDGFGNVAWTDICGNKLSSINLNSITINENPNLKLKGIYQDFYFEIDGRDTLKVFPKNKASSIDKEYSNIQFSNVAEIRVENNDDYKVDGNCLIRNSDNTLVVGCKNSKIPDYVTSIGDSAFAYCSGLTSIEIPSGVTSIGIDAFKQCEDLTGVYISDIASWCSVKFNSNPLYYAHNLYLNGELVTELVIPDGVYSISYYAFNNCSLTGVEIPSSVTYINSYSFRDCSSLEKVKFGEDSRLLSIGNDAFNGCSSLTSIDIPSNVTKIYSRAFSNCSSLESITVDEDNARYKSEENCLIEIDTNSVILGCKNSEIPNYVTSIGDYAFEGCSGLTSIIIPSSVTSIGWKAFDECSDLESVVFENTEGWYYATNAADTSGKDIDVTNLSKNARNLSYRYNEYYWKRNN